MTSTKERHPRNAAALPTAPGTAQGAPALWRQRLFEAEAGMTRFVATRADQAVINDWMYTRSKLFADLPDPTEGDAASWQKIFFRGQALMEKFIVSRFGLASLADWASQNAEVYRLVEPDHGRGASDPILRIGRQAELYGSRFEITTSTADEATIEIQHCAIWDYRERARERGVQLTLESPCQYCTKATAANIAARGFTPSYELTDAPSGPGCRWRATAPTDAEGAPTCAV